MLFNGKGGVQVIQGEAWWIGHGHTKGSQCKAFDTSKALGASLVGTHTWAPRHVCHRSGEKTSIHQILIENKTKVQKLIYTKQNVKQVLILGIIKSPKILLLLINNIYSKLKKLNNFQIIVDYLATGLKHNLPIIRVI